MDEVVISVVKDATPELAAGFGRLLSQLINHDQVVTETSIREVIGQKGVTLFMATLGNDVVGIAQLTVYRRLYQDMGWVDGVVVDSEVRGKGIGGKLMQGVLDVAKEQGLAELNLTSSPVREAANHLYQKLGFKLYDTNYYRYTF